MNINLDKKYFNFKKTSFLFLVILLSFFALQNKNILAATFDFTLSNDGNKTVSTGKSIDEVISSSVVSGTGSQVDLSVSSVVDANDKTLTDLRGNASAPQFSSKPFKNSFIVPPGSSVLSISTNSSTAPKTYTVTVQGNSASNTSSKDVVFYTMENMAIDTTKTISYYTCLTYSSTECTSFSKLSTKTLKDALTFGGYAGGARFYNDQNTKDKLCSAMYPDTSKNIVSSTATFDSPNNNAVIYWSSAKSAFVLINASVALSGSNSISPNNPVNPFSTFSCSNIVVDKINTVSNIYNLTSLVPNLPIVPVYVYGRGWFYYDVRPSLDNGALYKNDLYHKAYVTNTSFHADSLTANALCRDAFPDTPYAISYDHGPYSSISTENYNFFWNPGDKWNPVTDPYGKSGWWAVSGANTGAPWHNGKYDDHLNGKLMCASGKAKAGSSDLIRTTKFNITVVADPYNLKVTSSGDQCDYKNLKIALSWNSIPSATSYNIYRSTDGIKFTKINSTNSGSTISYNDSNGISGIIYQYKVVAVLAGIEQAYSEAKAGLYPKQNVNLCSTPPSTPSNQGRGSGSGSKPVTQPVTPSSFSMSIIASDSEVTPNNVSQDVLNGNVTSKIHGVNVSTGIPVLKLKKGASLKITANVGAGNYSSCKLSSDSLQKTVWNSNVVLGANITQVASEKISQNASLNTYVIQCARSITGGNDTASVKVQIVDTNIKEK